METDHPEQAATAAIGGRSPLQGLAAQLRRPFVRDASILQLGAFGALGVSFLLSIVLARLLGREAYGGYALVVSTMTTISLLKRLGQDYVATTELSAAYARRDATTATQALVSFNVVNLWPTLVILPLALLLAPAITEQAFGDGSLGEPLRLALLPPIWAMFMATTVLVLQCSRRLVALTVLENSSTLGLAGAALLGAVLLGGVSGVLWGQALASLLFALIAIVLYRRIQARDPLLPALSRLILATAGARNVAWRNVRAGLAVALDKNLVSLYPLVPILLLGSLAATEDVALLRVALSYLAVPLLGLSAISRLLMVKLPELHATQPEQVRGFFLRVTLVGGAASMALTTPFVLLAPWLIGLFYGEAFAPAATLVPLLALDPLLAGFGIAAGPLFRTYRRNVWAVWSNLGVLTIGIPLAYLLVQQAPLAGAALAYAGLVTALRFVAYVLCLKIVSTSTTNS